MEVQKIESKTVKTAKKNASLKIGFALIGIAVVGVILIYSL